MTFGVERDFGRDPFPDLHPVLAGLRAAHRVGRVGYDGSAARAILRHGDLAEAFRDDESFPAAAAYRSLAEPAQGRTMQCMDPPEHRVRRELVASWFSPASIAALVSPVIEPLAARWVDRLLEGGEADLVSDLARPFPFSVIVSLLGLPECDEATLRGWAHGLLSHRVEPERALAAREGFTRYLAPVLAQRRTAPGDDWLSRLVTAQIGGEPLADEEIFSFVRLLFPAGADTTYLALGNLLWHVVSRPDLQERLRSDPSARRLAVEESLRLEPAVAHQPRVVGPQGGRVGEVRLTPGAWVLFSVASANRDEEVFERPDRFEIDRPLRASLAFGAGPHHCLGLHLARAELEAGLAALLERTTEVQFAGASPPEIRGAIFRGPRTLPVRFTAA